MATIKELKEQIQSVNALGRANLSNAGIDIPEAATTYDIMQNVGLPDWDDDSPIIASGEAYASKNMHWELTEKGTLRWVMDYQDSSNHSNWACFVNSSALSVILNDKNKTLISILPKIKQIYIPDNCTATEFWYMPNCERVRLPKTLSKTLGMAGMTALKELNLNYDCYAGKTPDYHCNGMASLEKVILSPLTTELGQNGFQRCYSLREINLENITTFQGYCFQDCLQLAIPIVFNGGLVKIGDLAFAFTSIPSITFQTPTTDTLPTIRSNAFNECDLLKDIYCPWAEGEVANAPWSATNATIHYNTQYDENGNPITE